MTTPTVITPVRKTPGIHLIPPGNVVLSTRGGDGHASFRTGIVTMLLRELVNGPTAVTVIEDRGEDVLRQHAGLLVAYDHAGGRLTDALVFDDGARVWVGDVVAIGY